MSQGNTENSKGGNIMNSKTNNQQLIIDGEQYGVNFICKKIRTGLKTKGPVYKKGDMFLSKENVVATFDGKAVTYVATGENLVLSTKSKTDKILDQLKIDDLDYVDSKDYDENPVEGETEEFRVFALGNPNQRVTLEMRDRARNPDQKDKSTRNREKMSSEAKMQFISVTVTDAQGRPVGTICDQDAISELVKPYLRKEESFVPRPEYSSDEIERAVLDMYGSDAKIRSTAWYGKRGISRHVAPKPSLPKQAVIIDADGNAMDVKYEEPEDCSLVSWASMTEEFVNSFGDIISDAQTDAEKSVKAPKIIGPHKSREYLMLQAAYGGHEDSLLAGASALSYRTGRNGNHYRAKRLSDKRMRRPDGMWYHGQVNPEEMQRCINHESLMHKHKEGTRYCDACSYDDAQNPSINDTLAVMRSMDVKKLRDIVSEVESAIAETGIQARIPDVLQCAKTILKKGGRKSNVIHGTNDFESMAKEMISASNIQEHDDHGKNQCDMSAYSEKKNQSMNDYLDMLRAMDSNDLESIISDVESAMKYADMQKNEPAVLNCARTILTAKHTC